MKIPVKPVFYKEKIDMQKCKYLEDLGLKTENYGTNFMSDTDPRAESWEEEVKTYGFNVRETWNLDSIFIQWIYTRLMMYKERNCINLAYHKFNISLDGVEMIMTQGECIDKILDLSKEILLDVDNEDLFYENSRVICDIWKEIICCMWW